MFMDLADYQKHVAALAFGKRLPGALYVLRGDGTRLGEPLDALLETLVKRYEISPEFNVLKFRTDELKVSFLAYPEFESDPHPALRHAVTIDLVTGRARHTDYAGNANPPTRAEEAADLQEETGETERVKEARAFHHRDTEGTEKRGNSLTAKIARITKISRGIRGQDGESHAVEVGGVVVENHKIALTRYELSKPVKGLLEYGVLKPGTTFFLYWRTP